MRGKIVSKQTISVVAIGLATFADADISAACAADNTVLENNATLVALFNDGVQNQEQNGDTLTATFSNIEDIPAACSDAEGKYIQFDYEGSCSGGGETIKLEIIDYPLCAGMSCNSDDLNELEEQLDDLLEDLGDAVDGVTCSHGVAVSASSVAAIGTVVSAVWSLL